MTIGTWLSGATGLGLLSLIGCAGMPPATAPPDPGAAQVTPLAAGLGLLGAYTLELDPASASATLAPVREATAFGDSWAINATGFLNGAPCTDCLKITGIEVNGDNQIELRLRARHPFAPGNTGLPPSAANRLDLHVFDAQVLLAGDLDPTAMPFSSGAVTVPTRTLINPAGYSGLFTGVLQTLDPALVSTAYPYITLAEDRTAGNFANSNPNGFADLSAPTGHNVFAMGADVATVLTLGLLPTDGSVKFTLLFTCTYGQSAVGRSQRLNPVYALPEFNAKAPWRIEALVPGATNNLEAGNASSSAEVMVRVWDWQAATNIDATLSDIGAIRSASAPQSVELTVPGLFNSAYTFGPASGGTGEFDDPLVYNALILNETAAAGGDYWGLVRVIDSRVPGGNTGGQPDALSSVDGTTIDSVSVSSFVTYQTVLVPVSTISRQLLSIEIAPATRQIIAQGVGEAISFTAIGTFDLPPLMEDVTGSVVWDSSLLDVATFAGSTCTGVGMGVTDVTAQSGSVVSPATSVIVKPVEFLTLTGGAGFAFERPDFDQTIGTAYFACSVPANSVRVYSDQGIFQTSWATGGQMSGQPHDIAVDEAGDRLFVVTGNPTSNNTAAWSLTGTPQGGYNAVFSNGDIPGVEHLARNGGELWLVHHNITTFDAQQVNPLTGATLGGFNHADLASPTRGTDTFNDLLYVASIGGGFSGKGIVIADPATATVLASYSEKPANTGQNDALGVDRDGFVHLAWSAFNPNPMVVQVYEYTAPSTLTLLYEYFPAAPNATFIRGFGISRPNNVSVLISNGPNTVTWFQ